jgi:hypothetical protein
MLPQTCKIIRADGKLGERTYLFDVPIDVVRLSRKYNKCFLGMGLWRNNNKPYLVLARPRDAQPMYFSKETLDDMQKQIKGMI